MQFTNFRVLKDATLPLGRFTLIIGPNGSGKSTALLGLEMLRSPTKSRKQVVSADNNDGPVEILASFDGHGRPRCRLAWKTDGSGKAVMNWEHSLLDAVDVDAVFSKPRAILESARVYSLHPSTISAPVSIQPDITLEPTGAHLTGVLDNLKDSSPEAWERLNGELSRILPEFDRVILKTIGAGQKAFWLRTKRASKEISAADLSHGTIYALTILTLAHLPHPPLIIGLEDPDHGIHPRLLREVRDALYRLSYPERFGEKRAPVQVIATTHSPYLLDLFRDSPEEVVIAEKTSSGASFSPLVARDDITEILGDSPLGETWYSGILGGVPVES
jgi:predicted ATPase